MLFRIHAGLISLGEGRVARKPCICSGQWVQKHTAFAPARQKLFGFRLRSPLPSVEEPCPLSLQTVFSPADLRLITNNLGQKRRAFEPLCLSPNYFPIMAEASGMTSMAFRTKASLCWYLLFPSSTPKMDEIISFSSSLFISSRASSN